MSIDKGKKVIHNPSSHSNRSQLNPSILAQPETLVSALEQDSDSSLDSISGPGQSNHLHPIQNSRIRSIASSSRPFQPLSMSHEVNEI